MTIEQSQHLHQLNVLAASHSEVAVLWLYGSQAKGNASEHSDWDLAVAFDPVKADSVLDTRIRAELLAMDWQRTLGLAEGKLSVVDINLAPIPLAFGIINANKLIFSRDEGRRMQEESRIMSQLELDYSAQNHFIILDNAYITSLRLSLSQYQAELGELRQLLSQRPLSNLEDRSAERTLQVSIEACIGIAKHWAKALAGHSPQDAYQAFEILCQRGIQPADEFNDWRKVIGLRNALVHDHLNIDPEIIRSVVSQGYSDSLLAGVGMVIFEE
ncbi:type VII toxin-antitoxin system HepT family RNase toxin [Shewanella xiamenensis]|uniref:type VII toxin-antitoxin system HepT family RNase toxin n=1 Tax=Shewanella xiamenensis TaxID=332186 RepID=UPI002E7B3D79|nr:HepT-like ribonuclease domain-containing protein [Shewanella xiamenensis]